MALRVVRYRRLGKTGWGIAAAGRIALLSDDYATTGEFLRDGAVRARALNAAGADFLLREADVEILSPVTRNQQYVCQGVNYRDHRREVGLSPTHKRFNMIFRKASSSLSPPNAAIVRPPGVKLLDYELELALVIGREITSPLTVTEDRLHEFVAGLVITNDVSARDIQLPQQQFYKGKSFRSFAPTGPYLCLLDAVDVRRIPELRLVLSVNGVVRQNTLAGEMIYGPAETLSELSRVMDLFPGDLIATGTPAGVALRSPGPFLIRLAGLLPDDLRWKLFLKQQQRSGRYLKPGDAVRAAIRSDDGALDLGVQENRVVAAEGDRLVHDF